MMTTKHSNPNQHNIIFYPTHCGPHKSPLVDLFHSLQVTNNNNNNKFSWLFLVNCLVFFHSVFRIWRLSQESLRWPLFAFGALMSITSVNWVTVELRFPVTLQVVLKLLSRVYTGHSHISDLFWPKTSPVEIFCSSDSQGYAVWCSPSVCGQAGVLINLCSISTK